MNKQKVKNSEQKRADEEVIYLSLLLSHVKERLATLSPGINCTFEAYHKLIEERINLTLVVNKAILNSRGSTFVEETDTTYTYNNVVLKLGGVYRQRIRA